MRNNKIYFIVFMNSLLKRNKYLMKILLINFVSKIKGLVLCLKLKRFCILFF